MAMLLIVGGIVAVFLAHRKVAEKITEEEYQRFLDGEVFVMKENGKTYFLEDLFGEVRFRAVLCAHASGFLSCRVTAS